MISWPTSFHSDGQHLLGEEDDVVLVDEAHLDVELGELGLAVGAEVLVAVAARDLVVALDAADHEQLLEQLRALRQRVEAARLQARGNQEVAGALGRRPRQRRGLDLDELVVREHGAGRGVDLGPQPDGVTRALTAQVQVAVLQARFLTGLVVELERQRRALVEHLELGDVDLDRAGGDLEVLVALGTDLDHAGDLDAVLRAQTVSLLGDGALPEHHLGDTGRVTQIDEDHPAVITTPGNPTGEGYGLLGLLGSQ